MESFLEYTHYFNENIEQRPEFETIEIPIETNIFQEPEKQKPVKFILTKVETNPPGFLKKKTQRKKGPTNCDISNGRWTREEQQKFAEAVFLFGSDWKRIQSYIKTRCGTQVRSHAQKFLMRLKENPSLLAHGLQKNLSWTKTITYLTSNLSKEEMKEALEAVELGKNEPAKEKKEKVEKVEKIKKVRKKEKRENYVNKEKNGKKEKKEIKEKSGISKPKKCKVLGKSMKEKLRKKKSISTEKKLNGKKKKCLEGKRKNEELKITLSLEQQSDDEENQYHSESNNSNISHNINEEKIENIIPEKKEEIDFKNEEPEKEQKQSKNSSSTEVPESEYSELIKKEDEETGKFEVGLSCICPLELPLKQAFMTTTFPMQWKNFNEEEIEMKCKNNSCVYHYELENYDYDESKNFYLRENNFDFTSEDNHREMLSG